MLSARTWPSTTRTSATTPRYWSKRESKISARSGAALARRDQVEVDLAAGHGLLQLGAGEVGTALPAGTRPS